MNASWSSQSKTWTISFFNLAEAWILRLPFGEGIIALSRGGFIRNSMLIVPAPPKGLERLDFKKAYLVQKVKTEGHGRPE
jgi:hypothetical protein